MAQTRFFLKPSLLRAIHNGCIVWRVTSVGNYNAIAHYLSKVESGDILISNSGASEANSDVDAIDSEESVDISRLGAKNSAAILAHRVGSLNRYRGRKFYKMAHNDLYISVWIDPDAKVVLLERDASSIDRNLATWPTMY